MSVLPSDTIRSIMDLRGRSLALGPLCGLLGLRYCNAGSRPSDHRARRVRAVASTGTVRRAAVLSWLRHWSAIAQSLDRA